MQIIEYTEIPKSLWPVMTARETLEHASRHAEFMITRFGEVRPIYHAVCGDGRNIVFSPPRGDKDQSVAMVRGLFEHLNVQRYLHLDEAWMLHEELDPAGNKERELRAYFAQRGSIEDHPDRYEAVIITVETQRETLTASRRITRDANDKPSLEPLEIFPSAESEGRVVGLLPRPKGSALQ